MKDTKKTDFEDKSKSYKQRRYERTKVYFTMKDNERMVKEELNPSQ